MIGDHGKRVIQRRRCRDQKPTCTLTTFFEKWLERAGLRWKAKCWGKHDREAEEAVRTQERGRLHRSPGSPGCICVASCPVHQERGCCIREPGVLEFVSAEEIFLIIPVYQLASCRERRVGYLGAHTGTKESSRNRTCLHVLSPECLRDFLVSTALSVAFFSYSSMLTSDLFRKPGLILLNHNLKQFTVSIFNFCT